ncbi:uncharacterized protein LOC122402222 [Colletes gigas]|uniref:uncharacterized protein LOC122402222 n=1 Tax=Colletes gigas TaxID=935657 RepID=UPI001C9AA7DD|nr:uncharacterized protein LOC122402222 [Colletes gigas]
MNNNKNEVLKLNYEQQVAYNELQELLEKKQIILIDAPSGTGKTFMLSILAASYYNYNRNIIAPVQFITFTRNQASKILLKKFDAYTYVSYSMRNFRLSYHFVPNMFQKNDNIVGVLYQLITYAKSYVHVANLVKVIILDTYTIASPLLLILLCIVSFKNNIKLIFSGDKMQPGAVPSCALYNKNNSYIIDILSDDRIDILSPNMRSSDNNFTRKLSRFREKFEDYKSESDVPFYFNLRYLLYCLFRSKYFTEERFDTVYMAQYHYDITLRSYRLIEHLKSIKKDYVVEPFYLSNGKIIPMENNKKNKFLPGLLLVKDCQYVHINESGEHNIVRLEEMIYKDYKLHSLVVRSINDKYSSSEIVERCNLCHYQILPSYREWLLDRAGSSQTLRQFPLYIYSLTYHSSIGRTIRNEVEFNTTTNVVGQSVTANAVYVGLCCMTEESNIHKIHAGDDLLSFVVTEYMENERNDKEFYYRCPPNKDSDQILEYVSLAGRNEFIDQINWCTVTSTKSFEKKPCVTYLRIQRNKYKKPKEEKKETLLMEAAKFVKCNKNVILDIIKAIPNEHSSEAGKKKKTTENHKESIPEKDSSKAKKKKKKTKTTVEDYKNSEAYILLKNTYDDWVSGNKKNEE